uniref:Serpin domain-containing protein n=1 Tax=Leersia perrieri TaxID=77586 RepID=A0A0D9XTJ1_9ORYZ
MALDASTAAARDGQTALALRLTKHLAPPTATSPDSLGVCANAGAGRNVVFSPVSVHAALALVAAGAGGATLAQLLAFLGAPSAADLAAFGSQLTGSVLADQSGIRGPRVIFGGGVWADASHGALSKEFQDVAAESYKSEVRTVSFSEEVSFVLLTPDFNGVKEKKTDEEKVAELINDWVKKATSNLISSIVTSSDIAAATDLVLANAVYFKGEWLEHFHSNKPNNFYRLDGHTVKAQFMYKFDRFQVSCMHGFKVLKLSYKSRFHGDTKYSMFVFLPDERQGFTTMVDVITAAPGYLYSIFAKMETRPVDVMLPKFEIKFNWVDLENDLCKLGLSLPFSPEIADLRGMYNKDDADKRPTFLSKVAHMAVVKVNEFGTEAAATMASLRGGGGPPPDLVVFVADHPFTFFIVEELSGVIVFVGHTALALRLARHLAPQPTGAGKNVAFSPLSVHASLALVAAGARGATLAQLLAFLGAPSSAGLAAFGRRVTELLLSAPSGGPRVLFGGGLWSDDSRRVLAAEFRDVAAESYKSEATTVSFPKPEAAAKTINDWVKKATDNLINSIISPTDITAITDLILANAVYFKGEWLEPFSTLDTRPHTFHRLDGSDVKAQFMSASIRLRVSCTNGFKVLRLPYDSTAAQHSGLRRHRHGRGVAETDSGDTAYSMFVFLPDERDGLATMVDMITASPSYLYEILAKTETKDVKLKLPKFAINFSWDLESDLKKLGLSLPFSPKVSDLRGMYEDDDDDKRPTFLSKVAHGAVVKVNEVGTEAAAVMLALCGGGFPPPEIVEFVADHPFTFLIMEELSGVIVFAGHTALALRLAKHLAPAKNTAAGAGENVAFSPLSVHAALALAAAGAGGATLAQLLAFLGAPSAADLAAFGRRVSDLVLADRSSSGGPRVLFGGGVWADQSRGALAEEFRDVAVNCYKSETRTVDFRKPEPVAELINNWVKKATDNLIDSVISPSDINVGVTDLILANAFYFKAKWFTPFNYLDTSPGKFHRLDGSCVEAEFMSDLIWLQFACIDGFKVLRLPYWQGLPSGRSDDDTEYSMFVFLPDERDGFAAMVDVITAAPSYLYEILAKTEERPVNIELPKFDIKFSRDDLKTDLCKLGLSLPFSVKTADLRGMYENSGRRPTFLSKVAHTAVIKVNEMGTEAAAVSLFLRGGGGPPSDMVEFVADHPFTFFIMEERSGVIVFAGHAFLTHVAQQGRASKAEIYSAMSHRRCRRARKDNDALNRRRCQDRQPAQRLCDPQPGVVADVPGPVSEHGTMTTTSTRSKSHVELDGLNHKLEPPPPPPFEPRAEGMNRDVAAEDELYVVIAQNNVARRSELGNVAFSPLSVHAALALVAASAGGATLAQLLAFLGAPSTADLAKFGRRVSDLVLADRSASGGPRVLFCGGVWADESRGALAEEFRDVAVNCYKSETRTVDFRKVPETVAEMINNWVKKATDNLIDSIISPSDIIVGITDLILANAVYFKGEWLDPFNWLHTSPGKFHRLDGSRVEAELCQA